MSFCPIPGCPLCVVCQGDPVVAVSTVSGIISMVTYQVRHKIKSFWANLRRKKNRGGFSL